MAEHRLDVAQPAPVFKQGRCERVPEQVARSAFADGRFVDDGVNLGTQSVRGHPLAGRPDKESRFVDARTKPGPRVGQVFLDPAQRPPANGRVAVFAAFPLGHPHYFPVKVHVAFVEVAKLLPPDPGGVEGFEHGPVFDAKRG